MLILLLILKFLKKNHPENSVIFFFNYVKIKEKSKNFENGF